MTTTGDSSDRFSLQISEIGGMYQFVCAGTYDQVIEAYKVWSERIDKRMDSEDAPARPPVPPPGAPAGTTAGVGGRALPFRPKGVS